MTAIATSAAVPPDGTDGLDTGQAAVELRSVRSARAEPTRARHDAEFTAFVEAHADELLRTAWLLVGDPHRAEELTQQALVRTYAAWPRVRDGNPGGYARRVLVNLRVDTWRRQRREVLVPPDDLPAHHAEGGSRTVDDRDQLVRALRTLTVRQRRIVVLRHLVGLSEAEVADDLGVSIGTVKSTASRGLASLRHLLGTTTGDASADDREGGVR
ncbi:SigE family RNA polymerase sigma factor [Cellulomonas sp. JZ18]|uniref:SigE family RNA polymerase sigma factor n=1 Tax=Cellulomonas sp. JZ18 TaxID=2654191 RepID=UPI0012D497B8|nr:SigE family RNA polymerase sigma factor [Cellulomonas sp. JZ18]QGQ20521.1 SigE family RNA polymerase sigma factor [Cellulomonas sp. JZ18]